MEKDFEGEAVKVVRAWEIAGPVPIAHDAAKDRLRREWPTLYWAITDLVSAAYTEGKA